jgi:L-threonylcarbamoyladenylate synthase
MKDFWPGSRTLVVKKDPALSAWLGGHPSGKTETVGIRMPAHPIAREFIAAAGCPIAAPSANKSGRPSPTTAAHVRDDFGDAQMLILSGGAARVGLESTVVDCTGDAPKILRPGTITAEQVAKLLGLPAFDDLGESGNALQPRSPGTKYKHYAPKAKMTLLQGDENAIISFILKQKTGAGVLLSDQIAAKLPSPENFAVQTFGTTPEEIAQNLFSCLRQFDALNVEEIFAQALPESGIGVAIMDRLKKAAEGRIVHV